jgi:hypothetical protein
MEPAVIGHFPFLIPGSGCAICHCTVLSKRPTTSDSLVCIEFSRLPRRVDVRDDRGVRQGHAWVMPAPVGRRPRAADRSPPGAYPCGMMPAPGAKR